MKDDVSEETRADIRGAAMNAFALWREEKYKEAIDSMQKTFILAERRERTGSSLKEDNE